METPYLVSQSCSLWKLKVPVPSKPLHTFLFAVFLFPSPQATFLASVLSSLNLVPGMSSLRVGVFASQAGGSEGAVQPVGEGNLYTL